MRQREMERGKLKPESEKQATPTKLTQTPASKNPRYIPPHVRREVWKRDGGQCTFVSESGHRCSARRFLEFDHVHPFARGGKASVEGIRLRSTLRSPGRDPLAIWRKAAELGIVVSSQGTVEEFASPAFEDVLKELPNLNIIIEHLGGGGQDTQPPYQRYRRVLALARYPNTFMKVPGLGEISPRGVPFRPPFPFEQVPPLIEMAMDAFGARRLMWGSDFPPVAGRREGYRNALRWPMEHVPFQSPEDQEWVFGKTATTLFRFGE